MNIQRLKYFIRLAETLNFTQAASDCFIVQTAMSRQIAALEKDLGVVLFRRNTRSVELTAVGQEFYWHALQIVAGYEHALERINLISQNEDRNLRIGVGPYEQWLLGPVLKAFVAQHPDVLLLLEQYNYETLAKKFSEGVYDMIFCINHCAERVKDSEKIGIYSGDWGFICSTNNPISKIKKPGLSDISDQVLINMSEYNVEEYHRRMNDVINPKQYSYVNSFGGKITLVQANVGIAWVPEFVVEGLPDDVYFFKTGLPVERSFCCAYQPERISSPVRDEMLGLVRDYFSES